MHVIYAVVAKILADNFIPFVRMIQGTSWFKLLCIFLRLFLWNTLVFLPLAGASTWVVLVWHEKYINWFKNWFPVYIQQNSFLFSFMASYKDLTYMDIFFIGSAAYFGVIVGIIVILFATMLKYKKQYLKTKEETQLGRYNQVRDTLFVANSLISGLICLSKNLVCILDRQYIIEKSNDCLDAWVEQKILPPKIDHKGFFNVFWFLVEERLVFDECLKSLEKKNLFRQVRIGSVMKELELILLPVIEPRTNTRKLVVYIICRNVWAANETTNNLLFSLDKEDGDGEHNGSDSERLARTNTPS